MKEYKEILLEYSFSPNSIFSTIVPKSEWGKRELAEEYLEKYWLPYKEYKEIWKPLQDRIFVNQQKGLPKLKFAKTYERIALYGGTLFEESDFKQLQKCMQHVGDKHFVVIQNTFGDSSKTAFRMKFSVDVSWQELMGGSFISIALFEYDMNEYFVFGESGAWGKYAANDYIMPLDIIGFKSKYAIFFQEAFKISEKEKRNISEWIPPNYLNTDE